EQPLGRAAAEELARRCRRAVVEKAPLAIGRGADEIEPRQLARQSRHRLRTDALRPPGGEHRIAVGIVAERGDVVDGEPIGRIEAGEIERRVVAVAGEAELEQLCVPMPQLDHAFADGRESPHSVLLPTDAVALLSPLPALAGGVKAEGAPCTRSSKARPSFPSSPSGAPLTPCRWRRRCCARGCAWSK